ncbi:hypothetical protein HZB96_00315 [Candidatus Gottesmanbacteria bacterium]|nr:hypothetical protein [Candidatus Gottesmanbacteria bacterium]MBI5452301.1 hypothetical protein [Candidatus Gottesmanbacteria bacterium]
MISNIKENLSEILNDDIVQKTVQIFLLMILIFIIVLAWKWKSLPPQIPLFYSLPRSADSLGSKIQILTLPVYSMIFFLLDLFIASLLYKKERLISVLLVISGCIITFLMLITFLKIVFLVS